MNFRIETGSSSIARNDGVDYRVYSEETNELLAEILIEHWADKQSITFKTFLGLNYIEFYPNSLKEGIDTLRDLLTKLNTSEGIRK